MARTSRPKHDRREWLVVLPVCAVVALVAGAMPAIASFDVLSASGPSSTVAFASRTLPTPTGLACTWTNSTTETISWTGVGSTYSWMDGFQLKRSTNGGAYSNQGSQITPYSATSGTDAPASPASNSYTYKVYSEASTNWVSPDSSASPASPACIDAMASVNNGAAATAQLSSPEDVVFDSSGNMFIADTANHCIREIPEASGTNYNVAMTAGYLHTIAGTCGTSGSGGNGGLATSATLNNPEAVAVDASGNLYIADRSNNAVRKVTTGGTISLYAGTMGASGTTADGQPPTGAASKLTSPVGLAVDGRSNVYISDRANSVCHVYAVMTAQTKIFTAAGNGTCGSGAGQLNHAQQIVGDPGSADRVWVADTSNNLIRRIDCTANCTAASGTPTFTLTTVVGSGSSGDGDTGVSTGPVINGPLGVYVNSAGDIFIADSGNNKIKEVPFANGTYYNIAMTSGHIFTIAGVGTTGYTGEGYPEKLSGLNNPYSVAVYGGTAYMADTSHHMIRKISANYNLIAAAGIGTSGTGGNGTLPYSSVMAAPAGLATDGTNIYIADPSDNRIRKFWANSGEVATIAGTGGSGSGGDAGAATAATIAGPQSVAVDGAGNVFIADSTNCKIREVSNVTSTQYGISMTAGNIYTVAGTGTCGYSGDAAAATSGKINTSYGVAVDSAGNLYVTDYGNCRVRLVLASNAKIYTIDGDGTCSNGAAQLNWATGIAVDSSKNVYVADASNNRIKKLTCTAPCTAVPPVYTASNLVTGLNSPQGVATDSTTLFFTDRNNFLIKKVAVGGGSTTNVGGTGSTGNSGDTGPALGAAVRNLFGITVISGADVYFTQGGDAVIRKIIGPL